MKTRSLKFEVHGRETRWRWFIGGTHVVMWNDLGQRFVAYASEVKAMDATSYEKSIYKRSGPMGVTPFDVCQYIKNIICRDKHIDKSDPQYERKRYWQKRYAECEGKYLCFGNQGVV